MKVIRPATITDAGLISSSAPEIDFPAWVAGTTYTLGDRVILASTHRIYQSLQAGNLGQSPTAAPLWWVDVAPTNRWAMFDSQVSTLTVVASPLVVVLAPSYVNALAVLGVAGDSLSVVITDGPGGAVVYSKTVLLDGTIISDWYQYLWEPFDPLTEIVLTDLPPYINARITVTITGAAVACSVLVVGSAYELGDTRLGARIGIVDYSRKETDAFGTTMFVKRAYSKRLTADLMLPTGQVNKVQRVFAELRATPCVWVGSELAQLQPLVIYGFYKDFGITVSYPTYSLCNIEIEGLT